MYDPSELAAEFDSAAQIEPLVRRLSEVYRTGVMFATDNGELIKLDHTTLFLEEGHILWHLARELRPNMIIETGFGRGSSAAFFLSAIYPWGGRVISIDPAFYFWTRGIGVVYLERLGLSEFHSLIERPSEIVLPELFAQECTPSLRLSFIDGSHHFDGTLMDFIYLDRMTVVGGIIAMDDAHSPAVRTVLSFIANNLPYQIRFLTTRLVLCKKMSLDQREWCHFKPFRSSPRSDWNLHEEPPDLEAFPGATFGSIAEADMLRMRMVTVEAEAKALRRERDELKAEIEAARQVADALRESTSWRITAPLRGIRQLINGSHYSTS
jgi:predicted O-methyltransferase YrrM